MLKRLLGRFLRASGYLPFNTRKHYVRDGLATVHNTRFLADSSFQTAYSRGIEASRGVDPQFEWRVHVALWAARAALRVPGDFVECGVNAGFISSAILQHLDWNSIHRNYYLIDTFAGPVTTQFSADEIRKGRLDIANAALAAGAYVTSVESVRANFAEWPAAHVVQGSVPAILKEIDVQPVAFLHIDLNCAAPERAAFEHFWPRLSPGAMVLLDDYAYAGYECQAEAMEEAARLVGANILSLPTGQGLIIKG